MAEEEERRHSVVYIVIYVLTVATFALTLFFNFADSGQVDIPGLFQNSTADVSAYFNTQLTPAGPTFTIWPVIYAWQALWLIYGLSLICRETGYGKLYLVPGHQPKSLYLVYILNLLSNIAWLFIWDRFLPGYALIALGVTLATLLLCYSISVYCLYKSGAFLVHESKKIDLWLTRLFTHNGLGIYGAWVSVAFLINLDVVLEYDAKLKGSDVICQAILLVEVTCVFFLDVAVLDKYTRYTLTPYAVFVVAFTGVVLNDQWDSGNAVSIASACLLAWSVVVAVMKLVITVYRHCRRPLFRNSEFYVKQVDYGTLGYESTVSAQE